MHANLGYWMGVDSAGKGIMSEAVSMVLPFVFTQLELKRLHAATPARQHRLAPCP